MHATRAQAAIANRRADSHQNLLNAGRLWAKWCVKQRWLRADPFADVDPVALALGDRPLDEVVVDGLVHIDALDGAAALPAPRANRG